MLKTTELYTSLQTDEIPILLYFSITLVQMHFSTNYPNIALLELFQSSVTCDFTKDLDLKTNIKFQIINLRYKSSDDGWCCSFPTTCFVGKVSSDTEVINVNLQKTRAEPKVQKKEVSAT